MKTSLKSTLLACAMVLASSSYAGCYSEGIRTGDLQNFSQKGFVTKSWEGELVMEGTKISGSGGSVRGGNVWAFSVTDAAVAKVIDGAMMTGAKVALRYCQANPFDVTRGLSTNTPYVITQAVERK